MSKPKRIKAPVRFSLIMDQAQVDHVQHMARRMSVLEGRTITAAEAVRMAVETAYPLPKQLDLFR